jgi:uncharacterized protein (TIGR02145 family)
MSLIKILFFFTFIGLIYNGCLTQEVLIPVNNIKWVKLNLTKKQFNNGDLIKQAKSNEEWLNASENGIPAWCYYNNDPTNEEFGILYNWYAVTDSRGLVPNGYHVPTIEEIETLVTFLGEEAGYKTKSLSNWEGLVRLYQIDKCKDKDENTPFEEFKESTYNFALKNSLNIPAKICKTIYTGAGNGKNNLEIFPFGKRSYNGSFEGESYIFPDGLFEVCKVMGIVLREDAVVQINENSYKVKVNTKTDQFKEDAYFWTSSEHSVNNAYYWGLNYRETGISHSAVLKGNGYAVKYIKD